MAITLPDFTALPDVTPRAVGGVPSLPQEDPGAAGLAVLGKGITAAGGAAVDIAAYREVRRNRMDEALAGADFTNRVIPLAEALKVETDPEKITALRGQYKEALQASSAAIGNPETRQLWLLKNQQHVAQGEADVDLRNMVVYRDRWKAGAAQTLEDLARTGAAATDPMAYEGNRLRIDQVTEEAAKSGAMTAAEAQAHNNKTKIDMTAGRIDALMARNRFGEASALLQENRADLGPVAAAGFEARIEQKAEKAGIKSDISDAYYGAAGRPGGRVSLGPAGPGFDDLWSRVKGQEAGVGRAGEAKVSPKGAIGVSQILKETARGVAERMGVPYDEKRLYTDQAYNESLGKRYLQEMLDRYGGNRVLATAAYNAGPGRVDEWIGKYGDPRTGEVSDAQFAAQIPFSETRQYVRSVGAIGAPAAGAAAAPGAAPGKAGFDLSAGDSIGLSAIKNGGLPGTYADDAGKPVFDAARKPVAGRETGNAQSVGGRSPQGNLDYINAHPEEFQGKTVFWSTGLMNAGRTAAEARKALPVVEQQLDRLKELGANVVIAGVDKGRYAPLNSELEALATARQLPFAGALPTNDVHPGPQQMKAYVAAAQQLLPSGDGTPAGEGDYGGGGDDAAASVAPAAAPDAAAAPGIGGSIPPAAGPAATPAAPTGGPLAPHVDIEGKIAAVQARADAGEITQARADAVIAGVRHLYNVDQAKEGIARNALQKQLENGAAMLADGRDFDYDPTAIRHYFPSDQAEKLIQVLDDSRTAGQYTASVRQASPEDMSNQRAQLEAGLADPKVVDYARRSKLLNAFDAAVKKRDTELTKDPGAYTAMYNPDVGQKYQAFRETATADPKSPATAPKAAAAFADYAQATLAEQARLGIAEKDRVLLPAGDAAALASKYAALDPSKTNPVAQLQYDAKLFGAGAGGANDYWPQVFGEVVKQKLPGAYKVLATMDRPDQAVAADDMTRALALVSQKGGLASLKTAQNPDIKRAIDKAMNDELHDFRMSTIGQSGGEGLYADVESAAHTLAYYYGYRGESDGDAVKHAVDGILNNKYDFGVLGQGPSMARVPKGTLSETSRAADMVKDAVNLDQLGAVPVRDPALAKVMKPEEAKAIWAGAVRNGTWINNNDDSGLVLMAKLRNGAEIPVRRADGAPIELKFSDVPALAGKALPVPTGPEDIGARPGVR